MDKTKLFELLNSMSLDEKIGQLCQLIPEFLGVQGEITGPLGTFDFKDGETSLIGSVLNANGAKTVIDMQKKFMENHPHHIPMLFMMDVINGYETIFPIPLAQGCTFDTELSKGAARVAAKEAAAEGIQVTFSPMADLVRDSRWGRVMESTGEDPYLNYLFAKALVSGYQGDKLTDKGSIGACIKHIAGYGASEGGSEYYNCEISERTFFEDYLSGYQGAIDAGVVMAMTSFNSLNRIPSTANRYLMKDILRGKMGFDGVLISDWAAIQELINHTIAENHEEASELAINAGVDIDMMTLSYLHSLKNLVESGRVSEELVNESVMRVLELKNKLGLFENPFKDASVEDEKNLILCKEHRRLAYECAAKSFVLLKNDDNFLPLKSFSNTAFIGPYCDNRQIFGAWSWVDDEGSIKTINEELTENYNVARVYRGCSVIGAGSMVKQYKEELSELEEEALIEEAVMAASKADRVVLFLGEHRLQSGEAASRADISLPKIQKRLLDSVYEVNQNIAVVLFCGRPLELAELLPKMKSLLIAWFPGTEGAKAVADTLSGKLNPSGRLSISFPRMSGQCPVHYRAFSTGRPSNPNAEFNYASGYIDTPITPLFSFGYGLSYTSFAVSPIILSSGRLEKGKPIIAAVRVSNTGSREGETVVQMYIRDCFASVIRPVRELKGFEKISLKADESKTVSFEITEEQLRFYKDDMQFGSEPGRFELFIGFDSQTDNKCEFCLI